MRLPDWERGISGKTSGWEQANTNEFQDLGRMPGGGRENSGLGTGIHQRVWKILEEFRAGDGEYPGKLLPANRYTN